MRHTLLRLLKRAAQTHIIAHVISSREEEEAPAERAALDNMRVRAAHAPAAVLLRRTLLRRTKILTHKQKHSDAAVKQNYIRRINGG
mgnify:CR=1 FL=1